MAYRKHTKPTRKEKLREFIRHPVTDITVVFLIIFSVTLLIVEHLFLHEGPLARFAFILSHAITAIFIIELSIRYYVAESKRGFFRSYWIDIIAVVPVFRAVRFLRILRLLRLFRLGFILNKRISAVSSTFRESFGEITLVLVILIAVVFLGAIGVHLAERNNPEFNDLSGSFWWSFLSLMAGEPVEEMPGTFVGRMLLVGLMLSGMTIFAILTGVVSAGMVHRLRDGMKNQISEISKQRHHIIICGVNRMLDRIIEEIQYIPKFRRTGIIVVAEFEEETPSLSPKIRNTANVFFLQGDYTKISVLKQAGLDYADSAILLADKSKPRSDQDRDARTVLAAMLIERYRKDMGNEIFTCVELLNPDNKEQLKALDVEEVVLLDDYGGSIIAASSINEGMVPVFNELFTRGWGNAFMKESVPKELVGKKVLDAVLWLKTDRDAILLALERTDDGKRSSCVNPPSDMTIREDDQLILIAKTDCKET